RGIAMLCRHRHCRYNQLTVFMKTNVVPSGAAHRQPWRQGIHATPARRGARNTAAAGAVADLPASGSAQAVSRFAEVVVVRVGRPPMRRPFMGAAWSSHTSKNCRLSVAASQPAYFGLGAVIVRGKGFSASSSSALAPGGSGSFL